MEMPKPDHRHQQLARLAGSWRGDEKMPASDWAPAGSAIGIVENRVALDGFAVIQDYRQESSGVVTFRGHGVFTVEGEEVALYWFDTMGGTANIYRGKWQGEVLALAAELGPMSSRCVFTVSGDRYRFEMDMKAPGGDWKNMMTGQYSKAG